MRNPLTQISTEELRQLRDAHTLQEIGDQYGCSREYARQICERHGIVLRRGEIQRRRSQPLRQKALARTREVGVTQASRELGIPITTLEKWGARGLSPRKWSRDRMVTAGREWARQYGAPPAAREWDASQAVRAGRRDIAERWHDGDWPSTPYVQTLFGSWNAFIRECGFEPIPPGRRRRGEEEDGDG